MLHPFSKCLKRVVIIIKSEFARVNLKDTGISISKTVTFQQQSGKLRRKPSGGERA
jgi:hypothetical protein